MDLLSAAELIRFDGTKVKAKDALANKKVVAFYFSAHWCPPCRGFTPVLKKFYEDVAKDAGLEIIFVSSDHTPEDMKSYMVESHGQWTALEHGSDLAQVLTMQRLDTYAYNGRNKSIEKKYDISGIPTLVVVRVSDSQTITMDGVEEVQEKGNDAIKGWN